MKSYDDKSIKSPLALVEAAGLTKEEWARLEPFLTNQTGLSASELRNLSELFKAATESTRQIEKANARNLENSLADERKRSAEQQQKISELSEALAKATNDAASASAAMRDAATQRDNLRAELDALRTQYDTTKIYEQAAKYWQTKASRHEDASRATLKLFATLAIAFVIFIAFAHKSILEALPRTKDGDIGFAAIGALFFFLVPVFWGMRLLSRFITDHFTLTHDALERQTMMETFLSMTGHPNATPHGEEKLLILRSIFRPASATQDDGAPMTLLDAAKKLSEIFKK